MREDSLFRLGDQSDRKTFQDIKNQRKQEIEKKYQAHYKQHVVDDRKCYISVFD